MLKLQRRIVTTIELDNADGTIETYEDITWKDIVTKNNKMEIRKYIEEKYISKGRNEEVFRIIHPGGAISNPMNIKLQEEGSRVKPERYVKERERYNINGKKVENVINKMRSSIGAKS